MKHREVKTSAWRCTAQERCGQDSNAQIPGSCPRGAARPLPPPTSAPAGPRVATTQVRAGALAEQAAGAPWRPRGGEDGAAAWRGRACGDAKR